MLGNYSSEMQGVILKIIGNSNMKPKKRAEEQISISAGSKKLNILKNIQSKIYIKQAIMSDKIQQQKDRM